MIRLVRITTGARVVEATSIRSQAVLESFRGRFDAARSMIGGARHIAEEIGSTNALMEVELSAGTVELGAGDLVAAMHHLRRAQEGLTAMGLGADAAQAAALRARAALRLGQPDDALAFVAESERLSPQDLKSSILRKAVKAEVLAAQGEVTEALVLAEEAVALGERTDALVDHAEACAALAVARRAAGDVAGAAAAAAEARSLYEQKGATALAAALDAGPAPITPTSNTPVPGVAPVSNQASRSFVEVCERIVAGRLDEVAALVAPNVVNDDTRQGMGVEVTGVDAALEMFEVIVQLGIQAIDTEVLAVRGERLALVASTWRGEFEVPLLSVAHLDDHGQIDRATTYGSDALADAVLALEDAFIAEEGVAFASQLRRGRDSIDGYNRRDWERVRSQYAPDVISIDHRPGSYGTLQGADALTERSRTMVDIAPDYQQVLRRPIAISELVILMDGLAVATSTGGASYGIPRLMLAAFATPDSPIERFEFFGPDQLDLAMARFSALVAEKSGAPDNLAVEALRASFSAAFSGDFDRAREILAPDCMAEDRRPGLYSLLEGRDPVGEQFRQLRDLGVERVEVEVIAQRGDRLSLARTHWIGAQFEAFALFITDLDEQGLVRGSVCFEEDQLDAAMAELDARGWDEPTNAAAGSLQRLFLAVVDGDRDEIRPLIAPRCTFEDRRPGLLNAIEGVEPIVEQMLAFRPWFDRVQIRPVALRGERVALVQVLWMAQGLDVPVLFVTEIDEHGRSVGSVCFEETQLGEALAELEQRFGAGSHTSTVLTNGALESFRAIVGGIVSDDRDRVRSLFTPTCTFIDHRPGLASALEGVETMVDQLFLIRRLGVDRVDVEAVELRGDRVALVRTCWVGERFDVVALFVTAIDEHGRSVSFYAYEEAQLDEAMIETDARFHADEGAEHASWLSVTAPWVLLAHARRDWATVRSMYTPDVQLRDHRPVSRAVLHGLDQAVGYHQIMVDLQPTHRQLVRRHLAMRDHVLLSELVSTGAGSLGEHGPTEVTNLLVTVHDATGRTAQLERFEGHDEAAARALFDELVAQGHPQTVAERCMRRDNAAFMARDWDALAWIWDDDVFTDDRRRLIGGGISDRAELFDSMRFLIDSFGPDADVHSEVLGRSGEEHIACRSSWRGTDVELEVLFVATVSEQGRITTATFFDPDRVDEALAELESRSRTAAPTTAAQRAQRAVFDAAAAGDEGRLHELLSPSAVSEDRRPGLGAVFDGHDAVVANLLQLHAVGVEQVAIEPLALRGERLVLSRFRLTGAQYETEVLCLEEVDDRGLSIGTTGWEPDQLDDALIDIEERYHAGEGAVFASWLSVSMPAVLLAHRRRDWDALRALYAPDIQIVDHRPMAHAGIRGVEAAIGYHRVMVDLDPSHQMLIRRRLAIGDHVLVAEMVSGGRRGGDDPAGPYEVTSLMVSTHDTAGRTANIELYPIDDEPAALARFEDLVAEGQPQTMAERCARRANEALLARDWDALEHLYAPEAISDDRRRTMGIGVSNRETMFQVFGFVIEERGGLEASQLTVIGRNGEHAVACRALWSGGGAELEMIFVTTVNEQGRAVRVVFFDTEEQALAELELRGGVGETIGATPTNAALRTQRALLDAVVARGFEKVRGLLSPGCVSEDRRPGLGVRLDSADEAVENLRVIADLGLEQVELEPMVLRGERLALSLGRWMGDQVMIEMLMTCELDDDGLCRRTNWELDQLDEALTDIEARFYADEGAQHAAWLALGSPGLELAHARRDWDALGAMYTPDVELRDRRRIGPGTLRGINAAIEYQQAMVELDPSHRLLNRRRLVLDDHVALSEMVTTGAGSITDAGPTELASLLISVQDAHGLVSLLERFDPDDLAAARARFDALVAEGHPQTMAERAVRRVDAALLARDWDALEWAYADDAIGDDRRSAVGIGVSDRATMFQVLRFVTESFGGLTAIQTEVIGRNGEHRIACRTLWVGADVELEMHFVVTVDEVGRTTHIVFFDGDRGDEAVAELSC